MADGCDGFEFDVRLTMDFEAVVCHDPKVHGLEIAQSTAQQLSFLPRLRDVLARYRSGFLDIELKVAGAERLAKESVKEYGPDRFVISSFLPEVLRAVHELDAAGSLGLICETAEQFRCWTELPVDFIMPHRKLVRRDGISEMHDAGKKVVVWTVNAAREMERLAGWGVDGIISDDTKLLTATLG